MTEPSEGDFADLLESAQRGEAAGFDGLVSLVDRRLVGFSRARGADDPEGLANEVLVRACASIESFEGNVAQFRAWVFTIARNRLIDERRHFGRRVEAVPTSPEVLPNEVEPETETGRGRLEQQEQVAELLEALTDDQREVVLLRIVAGLSVEETATAVGRRPGAVRALQHRALRQLRAELTRDE